MDNQKMAKIACELADANREIEDLKQAIDKIKKSPFWTLSKPFRVVAHGMMRIASLVKRYGTLKGFARKVKSKIHEKQIAKYYGTLSFPDENQRKIQENEKFSKDIKFSILVPLYNTPEKFLTEMIDSVMIQTYGVWELCLADGSDEKHSYVAEICKRYADKDTRVIYKKLESNEGISGNTNRCYEMATGNFIALFDHDDILHPSALYYYMKEICDKNADYIYCDEATFVKGNIN